MTTHSNRQQYISAFLPLTFILLIGLFLRIGAINQSIVDTPVRGDARLYFMTGINLQESGIHSYDTPKFISQKEPVPSAHTPPVYPAYLALLISPEWKKLTTQSISNSIKPAIYGHALASTTTILFVFIIGANIGGSAVGLLAALLTSISPHLVNFNIYLLTETVFTFWFWLALALTSFLLTPNHTKKGLFFAFAGALFAIAALTRPTVQYLPFLIFLLGYWYNPQEKHKWLVFILTSLVILGGWGLRNKITTNEFSNPLAKTATIQLGIYPDLMYQNIAESQGQPYRFDPELTDYSSLEKTLSTLKARAKENPAQYIQWYLIGKPLMLFNWEITQIGQSSWNDMVKGDIYVYPTKSTPYANNPAYIFTYLLSRVMYFPLLLLTALFCIFVWLPKKESVRAEFMTVRALAVVTAYVIGIHMIGAPLPRYAVPFYPLIYLLGVTLALRVAGRLKHSKDCSAKTVQPV